MDFYGKIIVAKDAQRTEAYQENHNILLSDGAKVDTKPQLEIYADDVKCSHGATIGRLNEEEQFYMRSRGISLEDAKVLQMISFIAPVLENIEDETEREAVASKFEDAIRNAISIGGDSDTLAAITGAVAEAYYGMSDEQIEEVKSRLDPTLLKILNDFKNAF